MSTTGKKLTFKPLKRGRYRCNQTGDVMTRSQIPTFITNFMAGNRVVLRIKGPAGDPPKKQKTSSHPSKYRAKHG